MDNKPQNYIIQLVESYSEAAKDNLTPELISILSELYSTIRELIINNYKTKYDLESNTISTLNRIHKTINKKIIAMNLTDTTKN